MSEQISLLDWSPPETHRYGETYDSRHDFDRLNQQQRKVFAALSSGKWLTLAEIHDLTGAPEASASARIRDLRNMFGLTIDRRRRTYLGCKGGTWEYKLNLDTVPRGQ